MSATEGTALPTGLELSHELSTILDGRTLEILERRRIRPARRRGWLTRRLLFAADLIGLLAGLALAECLVNLHNGVGVLGSRAEVGVFLLSLPLWTVVAKLYGLYDKDEERTDHSTTDDFAGVFHMITVCTFLFWAFCHVSHIARPAAPKLVIFWAAAVVLISVGRAGARALARRNVAYLQNTVIVGAGDVGQLIAKKLLQHPEYGINLIGFVDPEPKERREDLGHLALLGDLARLPGLVRAFDLERVIFAFSNSSHDEVLDLIRELNDLGVQVDIVPRLFELVGPGVDVHTVEGLPLIGLPPFRLPRSSRLLKRWMDVCVAVPALILLAPLFMLIAVLIKLDSPGPIFFRQLRMGSGDDAFLIWKFRTMVADADLRKHEVAHLNKHCSSDGDPRMFKVPDDPRVTRLGRLLRRFSLDELPQLFNVVHGEMSLVGPRPLILDEDRYVEGWAKKRLHLKPGITGLWQVTGRTEIPFGEMVRLDYLYVTNWSPFLDLRLLCRTIPAVVRRQRAA